MHFPDKFDCYKLADYSPVILISLGINPVGDCSEMAVLSFRSSFLVIINQVLRIIKIAVKSDVKTGN